MSNKMMSTVGRFIALAALLGGCATTLAATPEPSASPVTDYGLRGANVDYLTASAASPMGLPQGAQPGQCYARVVVPAKYEQVTEQVVKKAGASRIEIVPAQFQDVEERLLVRPASTRLEAVPAVFEEVEEQVLLRPATTRFEPVPATYRTVTERILVRPAYTVWKRSSELTAAERSQQAVDPGAGDILCLVEVPAEYQTVMVRKMVAPERQTTVEIPAEYDTVSRQVLKSTATAEWREVLCDNNATAATLSALQQALRNAGFDPGRIDGRVDPKTMSSVRAFQVARGLPVDGDRYINMATVKSLGVTP